MFTPPASPQPPTSKSLEEQQSYFPVDEKATGPDPAASSPDYIKQRKARRFKLTAIILPLSLVLFTLSIRCITHSSHPMFMDLLTFPGQHRPSSLSIPSDLELPLLPELTLERRQTTSLGTAPTPTTSSPPLAGTAQPVPTIPDNPTLPTPFPQPFDKTLNYNGSSASCVAFVANMTTSTPFRACRPFSMLVQTSSELLAAQNNLTLLNSVIYGTCHTTIPQEQCSSNMAWFANNMRTACSAELSAGHALVTDTITGLQTYDLMRETGCLADPTTNTYCYVNAVHNTNPSDIYFYQIPLGLVVPKTSTPTCSPCTKNIMALYAEAIENEGATHRALVVSYPGALAIADAGCGDTFARAANSNAASPSAMNQPWTSWRMNALLLLPLALSSVFYMI